MRFFVLLDKHPPLWVVAKDPPSAAAVALEYATRYGTQCRVTHVLREETWK